MRQEQCAQIIFTLKKKGVFTEQEFLDYYGKLKALAKPGTEVLDFADSLPKATHEQEVLYKIDEQRKNILSIKNNVQFFAWLTIISLFLVALYVVFGASMF